jgi:hypothetical protein
MPTARPDVEGTVTTLELSAVRVLAARPRAFMAATTSKPVDVQKVLAPMLS